MKHSTYQLGGFAFALLAFNAAFAASADLATVPLANATTATILPNIAFILDDSGSMDSEYMPDAVDDHNGEYCYKWYGYNTLYYNPSTIYSPPIKADGTYYPNASFSAALKDGYFASGAKMYDGSTNNTTTDLAALSNTTTTRSIISFTAASGTQPYYYVSSIRVTKLDGSTVELLASGAKVPSASGTNNIDTLGTSVRDAINARTSTTGFSATYNSSGDALTITAPTTQEGLVSTPQVTWTRVSGTKTWTNTPGAFAAFVSGTNAYYTTHKTSTATTTTCAADSNFNVVGFASSIAAPGVATGSAEAKTNYANWYSYYRKRAYLAKAAAGFAFSDLEQGKYRVGMFYINSRQTGAGSLGSDGKGANDDLKIDTFTGTHRDNWFARLYGTRKDQGTPLREALTRAGRMYAGKLPDSTISGATVKWDPVQYSCQRNFAILTTDGYWNTIGSGTATYGTLTSGSTSVGDQDGVSGVTRPSLDALKTTNTLADVAYYYYHTDLRTTALNNCTGAPVLVNGSWVTKDVCNNDVPPAGNKADIDDVESAQHMTTFTIGLGVDGTLAYKDGYKTSTSGDYYDILTGTKDWPNVSTDAKKIDDLWHAAVDGRGTYFSAKNADTFAKGISDALGTITASTGSGAAAATSNLEPTAGDNYIYIANYRTVLWDGELSAYEIDLSTGQIAPVNCTGKTTKYCWQVNSLLASRIVADGAGLVGNSDTRTIKTWSSGATNNVKDFLWSSLDATEKGYFNQAFNSSGGLTQYADWSSADVTAATGDKLVNYLRGQDRNEDQIRDVSYGAYNRLFRDREKILGDIVHTQPVYVKAPFYEYLDIGYTSFKASQATRAGTVYIAANDGMLHAFDSTTGAERWAYIPPLQLKDMWRLADKAYATNHRYYLDGPISVTDVYDSTTSSWKTILVGAMGKGGRGIYALDITVPTAVKALWNFTSDNNANLGYTYGAPIITKLADGTWVALIASGYNNVSPGNGKGYVFVLNAMTGTLIKTLTTDTGDTITPSGLAQINIKVNDFQKDNTATKIYGGDLLGNLWRFDPEAADGSIGTKIVSLGNTQPITAAPEIGEVNGYTTLFFGTGRYLGEDDLALTDTQSFYAIKDDGSTTVNVGTQLVQQTMGNTDARLVTGTTPDWATKYGWYLNLPGTGERVHLPAQLYFGTLLFSSTIPTATDCQPGGYSFLYALDYATGLRVSGADWNATKFSSPLVGFTVSKLSTGTPKVQGITADGGLPTGEPPSVPLGGGGTGSESGMRIMWRELLN